MISRSLAILLAIVGLYLSAFDAAAQPRGGGWRGGGAPGFMRGGGFGGGRFGGPGRFGGAGRFGGGEGRFVPSAGARGFGGPPGGFTRGYAPPQGGGYGDDGGFPGGARGFSPLVGGFRSAPARPFAEPGRAFGGDWASQQNEVRRAVREGRQIPLGQAIEAVRRRAPGRELDAGLEAGPNGRPVYRLRWAGQDGRRQDYVVDAGTGAVLGVQGGP